MGYRFIHFIPKEKFTAPFIKFVNQYYDAKEHLFLIRDSSADCEEIPSVENVKMIDSISRKDVNKYCTDSTGIILHQFSVRTMIDFFVGHCALLEKACWVIWGSDLYEYERLINTVSGKIKIFIKRYFTKRLRCVATFAHDDYLLAKKWYGVKGNGFDILYPSTINKNEVECIFHNKKSHANVNIMIGNSATDTNQHIEVLHTLEKFKDEDMKLYVPLSYGDMEYRDRVILEGNGLFSEKFIPITEFMTPQKYSELLSEMDIAIFNNNRQQATGNIELLSYFGAKMFLRSDTTMWNYYVQREKRKFFDFSDISKMDFEDFIGYSSADFQDNHDYFSNIWDTNNLIGKWNNVFNYLNE